MKIDHWQNFLKRKTGAGAIPTQDHNYDDARSTWWASEEEAFKRCIKVDPRECISLKEVSDILHETDKGQSYPLQNHQGSAFAKAQEDHIHHCINSRSARSFSPPVYDGTNACVFLSLKICEMLISKERQHINWEDVEHEVEQIIGIFPTRINEIQDRQKCYEVEAAYDLMHRNKEIKNLALERKVQRQYSSLNSDVWRAEMTEMVEVLEGISIVTVPPYSFVVPNLEGKVCIVDTHRINESLGGNGKGIIKVFPRADAVVIKRLLSTGERFEFFIFGIFNCGRGLQQRPTSSTNKRCIHDFE